MKEIKRLCSLPSSLCFEYGVTEAQWVIDLRVQDRFGGMRDGTSRRDAGYKGN